MLSLYTAHSDKGAPLPRVVATSVGICGSYASILGSDPQMSDVISSKLSKIFQSHGAVRLSPPCLRPRDQNYLDTNKPVNAPAELINDQGCVLLMRENLTTNFARAVARCGLASNNLKRYDIDKVFRESDAG